MLPAFCLPLELHMLRIPLALGGLAAVSVVVFSVSGALAGVSAALNQLTAQPSAGPLMIRIERPSGTAQANASPKQTRCLLHWIEGANNARGHYAKDCSSTSLPR